MRELVLLLLILGSIKVSAEVLESKNHKKLEAVASNEQGKKKLKLAPSPGKNEDPGSATRLLYEDPRDKNSPIAGVTVEPGSKKIVKPTCTDNLGMVFKDGDKGYDGCMRTFNTQPALPETKRSSSIGITIGQ